MGFMQIAIAVMIFVNLLFAGMIYFYGRKKWTELFYALTSFFASIWSFATLLLELTGVSRGFLQSSALLHYAGGALAYVSILWFAVANQKNKKRTALLPALVSFLIIFLLSWMLWYPGAFFEVKEASALQNRILFVFPGYALFVCSLTAVFLVALLYLFREYEGTDSMSKLPMKYIILATVLGGTSGIAFNLYFPWFGNFQFFATNPIIVTLCFTGISFFTLFKYHIFNIRIVGVEILAFIIWILSFIQIFFTPSNNQQWLSVSVFVLTIFFGVLLIRSVRTEIKVWEHAQRLAGELQQINKELERINRAKSDFLSAASHQLKTPLSIIKGYVAMMLEGMFGRPTNEMQSQLQKVYISNERLIGLVNDLLDFSQLEEGRIQYNFEVVDLRSLIASVVGELRPHVVENAVTLQWDAAGAALFARADKQKIRSVIFNMIDNAIKYTDTGAITITARAEHTHAILEVADTGRGMNSTDLRKIFKKFERGRENRVTGSRRVTASGFGLGLYIAKFIMKDHKGTITASSEGPGKGSVFRMTVPLARIEKSAENVINK